MKFVPFENIFKDSTSNFTKVKKEDYQNFGAYPIVDQGQAFIGGYTDDENLVVTENLPVIIFGDHTKIFKYVDFPFTIGADGVKVLTLKNQKDNALFYYYFLKSIRIVDKGYSRHFKYLKEKKFPVTEYSDQLHIANLLSKAENLIAQRKESIRLLDEFLKSTFLEMFGDIEKMKNMKSNILSDYIEFLTSGSRGWAKYYSKSGAKFLRIQNVWKGTLRKDELQFVDAPKTQEAIRTRVQEGDLLITITADLGRTAVVPKNFGEAYINQHIALVRLKKMINPTYAAYYFFMPFGYSAIQKKNKSAVKSGLTFNDIKTLPIIVPPIELQTQFAHIVEKKEALKTQYQHSLQELENLYGSLSQRAFRGELTIKEKI